LKAIIIFIKNPVLGKVKTRLAATVGDEKALAIYHQLLLHTQKITSSLDAQRLLFYSDHVEKNDDWSSILFEKKVQNGHDLGERMKNAFAETLSKNQKVIIIGSDCAELTTAILDEAFLSLEKNDFVVGPAVDGGYYLLGMNYFEPALFDDIVWSSDAVLEKTIEKIKNLNKNVAFLPQLNDTDNEEDWLKIKHLLED
jgi:uncharacterized protein